MRRTVGPLVALLVAQGCGGALPTHATEPRSSFEDPPPSPIAETLESGEGREQAHELLVTLVQALIEEDAERLSRLLDERLLSAAAMERGDVPGLRSAVLRETWLRQLLASVHAARLPYATRASAMIDASSIEVALAGAFYPRDGLPREILPSDVVVRFRVSAQGRRALSGLAPSGVGLVVIRPGAEARVIAR